MSSSNDGPVGTPNSQQSSAALPNAAAAVRRGPVAAIKNSPHKTRKQNRAEYPASFWYEMCEKFSNNQERWGKSHKRFLASEDSGILVVSDRGAFGKRLKRYKEGTLPHDDSIKRNRNGKYEDVERCLLAFLDTRDHFSEKGKVPISWSFLEEMARRFAVALGHDTSEFSASSGWLSNALKRGKKKVDFDASEENILFYLDSIKKYCRKEKLGTKARKLSLELHDVVTTRLARKKRGKANDDDDDDDEDLGNIETTNRLRDEQKFSGPAHNFMPSVAPPLPLGVAYRNGQGQHQKSNTTFNNGASLGENYNHERFQSINAANFGDWLNQRENV